MNHISTETAVSPIEVLQRNDHSCVSIDIFQQVIGAAKSQLAIHSVVSSEGETTTISSNQAVVDLSGIITCERLGSYLKVYKAAEEYDISWIEAVGRGKVPLRSRRVWEFSHNRDRYPQLNRTFHDFQGQPILYSKALGLLSPVRASLLSLASVFSTR